MSYPAGGKLYWQNGEDNSSQYLMLSNHFGERQIPDLNEKITSSNILEFCIA